MTPSAKTTKVKVDKRFNKMLNDPSFNMTSRIDKYGRVAKTSGINNELK